MSPPAHAGEPRCQCHPRRRPGTHASSVDPRRTQCHPRRRPGTHVQCHLRRTQCHPRRRPGTHVQCHLRRTQCHPRRRPGTHVQCHLRRTQCHPRRRPETHVQCHPRRTQCHPRRAEDPRPVSSPAQAGDPRLASSIGHGSTPSRGPALDALSDLAGQRLETSGDGSDSQPTADQPTVSSTVFPDAGSEGFQLLSTGSTSLAKSRIDVSAFASGMPPKRNELESSKSPSRARRAS